MVKWKWKTLSHVLLFTTPWTPPGSSVHGILQARILKWIVISFSRGSSQSRDWTQVSCIARVPTSWASLVPQLVKNLPAMWFHPWAGKILWRWERLPAAVIWTEEFHGLCSPWGRKQWDMTEQLSLSLLHCRQTLYHRSHQGSPVFHGEDG